MELHPSPFCLGVLAAQDYECPPAGGNTRQEQATAREGSRTAPGHNLVRDGRAGDKVPSVDTAPEAGKVKTLFIDASQEHTVAITI